MRSPSQANGSAFEQPWRTLGEVELDCVDPAELQLTQVHTVLEQCIPLALTGKDMRAEIESALFDALGRIDRGAEKQDRNLKQLCDDARTMQASSEERGNTSSASLRILVVASQAASALGSDSAARDQYPGWSFFVIERPATVSLDGNATRRIIEVCLYHE